MGSRPDPAFSFGSNLVTPAAPVLKSAPGAGGMPLPGWGNVKCTEKLIYNIRLAFPAALATLGHMQPEPLPPFRSVRWRLAACAIRPAGKPSRQQPRQRQPHRWPGQATNASNPQPPPERHLLAVSPFVTFLHFQNRVTKRDKTCQNVPKGAMRLFCRNDESGHCCRGVSLSSGLRLPSPPSGEKVRMRGRSQSTGRPYSSFLQIRSSLVWFGLVWSSPEAPPRLQLGGPEWVARRAGQRRWPFPWTGIRPAAHRNMGDKNAKTRKIAPKRDKPGLRRSSPAVFSVFECERDFLIL